MSNRYGSRSLEAIDTVDPHLRLVFETLLPHFDHSVLVGERTRADQDAAVAGGKSKTPWPTSGHNNPCRACRGAGCGFCRSTGEVVEVRDKLFPRGARALDVMPYPLDWDDFARIRYFAGWVMATARSVGVELVWGGDWDGDTNLGDQTFNDLVHFELSD